MHLTLKPAVKLSCSGLLYVSENKFGLFEVIPPNAHNAAFLYEDQSPHSSHTFLHSVLFSGWITWSLMYNLWPLQSPEYQVSNSIPAGHPHSWHGLTNTHAHRCTLASPSACAICSRLILHFCLWAMPTWNPFLDIPLTQIFLARNQSWTVSFTSLLECFIFSCLIWS